MFNVWMPDGQQPPPVGPGQATIAMPADKAGAGEAQASGRRGRLATWWAPFAVLSGIAVIYRWPWRWQPAWLGAVPDAGLRLAQSVFLLVAFGALLLGRRRIASLVLVVVAAGLVIASPAGTGGELRCGSATILTPAELAPAVSTVLDEAVRRSAIDCASALRVVRADGDVARLLAAGGAAVGGVITAEPAVLRDLDPGRKGARSPAWNGVGTTAEPVAGWTALGRDVASIYLNSEVGTEPDPSKIFGKAIRLAGTQQLSYQAADPADPVVAAVAAALGPAGAQRLAPTPEGFGRERWNCPAAVILPGSLRDPPCVDPDQLRATVVDESGTPIGVPVFGIPVAAPADRPGPGRQARTAVREFFTLLGEKLVDDRRLAPAGDLVAAVSSSQGLRPVSVPPPRDLVAVLDASLSTGTSTGDRTRGGVSPLEAGLAGLRLLPERNPVTSGGQISVLVAQRGAPPNPLKWPAAGPPGQRAPVVRARGETDLPAFLARAAQLRAASVRAKHRVTTVLLTDGRNVFGEQRVEDRDLRDLSVLVIGNERGCAAVPEPLWNRCSVARGTGDDVAAQLARIFAT